ncbi:MAG: YfhO family protein [Clostridiales bacterium]|nr:YfhO family protein [Clostridiales bacterium]
MMMSLGKKERYNYIWIFLSGVVLYLLSVLPSVIYRGGLFYYYGDYNFQTIEFYTSAVEAVKNGFFYWNPNIEWGASMAGSYAFYLWGSPFFWISTLFPTSWIPYILPVIMSLRYGCAALTAYVWIRQYTRTSRGAVIGALLYAFSGYQAVNIVFSSFHDVTAFFPLYLYIFDRLMQRKDWSRTVFALMTALMLIINYYFFFGEVVFLIMYFFVRYYEYKPKEKPADYFAANKKRMKANFSLFLNALLCGALGVVLASFFIVQAMNGLVGNTRLGNIIQGNALLAYDSSLTIWTIIKSLFFVPELMGRQALFQNTEISWASVSLYLPCISIAGVIAYIRSVKNKWSDWTIRMIVILSVVAVIPGLNALFSALNVQYYARWFYIPILIMSMMTSVAFENEDVKEIKTASKAVLFITGGLLIFSFLPGQRTPVAKGFLSIPDNFEDYWLVVVSTVFLMLILFYVAYGNRKMKEGQKFISNEVIGVVALSVVIMTGCVLFNGTKVYTNSAAEDFVSQCLEGRPELDESLYTRIENDNSVRNWSLIWNMPNNNIFLSTVHPSTFEVFENLTFITRTQISPIPLNCIGLRQLLSTRYYLNNQRKADIINVEIYSFSEETDEETSETNVTLLSGADATGEEDIPQGFEYYGETDGFDVYVNPHFIPMGFTYDYFIRDELFQRIKNDVELKIYASDRILVRDLILTDEQAERYADILEEDAEYPEEALSEEEFYRLSDERAASACTTFTYDPSGYQATIDLPRENLVFFTIPWDKGFTAYVDGEEATLEKVDYGFIAVLVPEGEHSIRLEWKPYGIEAGIAASVVGLLLLVGTAVYDYKKAKLSKV